MTFFEALPWLLGIFLILVLIALVRSRRPRGSSGFSTPDDLRPSTMPDGLYTGKPPKQFRDGGTVGFKQPDPYEEMARPRPHERIEQRRRETAKASAALAASYAKPSVILTPRMIERMNQERRRRGVKPLNRTGLNAAIATAATERRTLGNQQPTTTNDWLTYLIMYECLSSDHGQSHAGGTGGLTIEPEKPFNGAGGSFAGAGASGDWSSPDVAATHGAAVADIAAPLMSTYSPGDTVGGYDSAPSSSNPAPIDDPSANGNPEAYSPPQSAPEPSSDSSSSSYSSSSDSSSSSSYDSGSSSSDSGSSGGGDGS